jgi:hypothetical protein
MALPPNGEAMSEALPEAEDLNVGGGTPAAKSTASVTGKDHGAIISPCGFYRYHLWRRVGGQRPGAHGQTLMPGDGASGRCVFVMLNPSTADADRDDPTIRRCSVYARRWGFEWLDVLNIFAYRSTDPSVLPKVPAPIGPENDRYLITVGRNALVVCAWGKPGALYGRGREVAAMLRDRGVKPHYLKLNGDGSPAHPLYLKSDLVPTEWT